MHYIAGICIYHRPQFRLFSLSSRTASYATSTSQDMSKETLKIRSPSPSPDTSITTIRYDLYRGHPNMKLLPQSEMKTIMSDMLDEDDDSWLRYLNYGANAGSKRFRASLRSFLQRRTKDDDMGDDIEHLSNNGRTENDDHELFITNGVSHGLELLCRTCTKPGDEVWIERPTYFLAPMIFESNHLIVKSLPMMTDRLCDDDNSDVKSDRNASAAIGQIDIDRLIHMVEEEGIPAPKMMYIIPSYHNPTGTSMPVDERKRLASFALKHGVMLVADEVYHLLDWKQQQTGDDEDATSHNRPAGIVHFNKYTFETKNDDCQSDAKDKERFGCCISVSSVTKIWGPGVRLGWIDAPTVIIQRLSNYGYIDSQGGVAPFMGKMMYHAIESNLLDTYLDKLKLEYAERYELMCNILSEEPRISILTELSPVNRRGGYFIWIGFPSAVNSYDFSVYSLENYGIRFMAGEKCDPFTLGDDDKSGLRIRNCARLCYADLDREDLVSGTKVFVEAFRAYIKSIE